MLHAGHQFQTSPAYSRTKRKAGWWIDRVLSITKESENKMRCSAGQQQQQGFPQFGLEQVSSSDLYVTILLPASNKTNSCCCCCCCVAVLPHVPTFKTVKQCPAIRASELSLPVSKRAACLSNASVWIAAPPATSTYLSLLYSPRERILIISQCRFITRRPSSRSSVLPYLICIFNFFSFFLPFKFKQTYIVRVWLCFFSSHRYSTIVLFVDVRMELFLPHRRLIELIKNN